MRRSDTPVARATKDVRTGSSVSLALRLWLRPGRALADDELVAEQPVRERIGVLDAPRPVDDQRCFGQRVKRRAQRSFRQGVHGGAPVQLGKILLGAPAPRNRNRYARSRLSARPPECGESVTSYS